MIRVFLTATATGILIAALISADPVAQIAKHNLEQAQ